MCKCALKTDYHDCYDIWFEIPAVGLPCFSRLAADSWSVNRTDMFLLFEKLGIAHPAYRKVTFFHSTDKIVVYTDPFSHCGEGKLLLTQAEALALGYSDCLASLYIADILGMSYRYFVIAGKGAWFQHWSTEDWRSNCGDGDLSPLDGDFININEIETACIKIENPVFAIDFVASRVGGRLLLQAIDWNPAPRLAGTPAQDTLVKHFGGNQWLAAALTAAILKHGVPILDNNKIMVRE